ncbi:PhoH family protein [Paenibacillus sp. FSL R7-0302]|uniref:PhoH family protein n=1 Tax=Paenibacillus sp. FSL R7-0302 TaxID=2921681 RepID=UPI0030F6FC00
MLYVVDTNVLLDKLEVLVGHEVVILSHVLRELDKHKSNRDKPDLAFRARKAVRHIEANQDKFVFDLKDYVWDVDDQHEAGYVDNMIIQACVESGYGLITEDVLLKFKAKGYNIPLINLDFEKNVEATYTGVKEIEVFDEEELNKIYNDETNMFDLLINQYLVIKFNDEYYCYRWTGEFFAELVVPPGRVVNAQNAQQLCALDLLWDTTIPIKFIIGTYGSGKTYLSSKVAIEFVKGSNSTKHYRKLMMVRNPIGSGEQIGFLKGTKEDKTSDFFKPIVQHLDKGEFEADQMERDGILKKEIPYYMKGLSISDTFILVDEAEDLTLKLVKLIGTRLAEHACVVFSGDFNQAEEKYIYNNGLYQAVDKLKGNPLVGVVMLNEDVRSSASKVFADL